MFNKFPAWRRVPRKIRETKYSHLTPEQFVELQREGSRLRREKHDKKYRVAVWEYKRSHPCVDCGENDPVVLEFDHKDQSEKGFSLGRVTTVSRFYEEVKKCVVRCANCHRRRTAVQLGFWKNLWDDADRSKVKAVSDRGTRENIAGASILDEFQ